MEIVENRPKKPRGRPRSFDEDTVLDAAVLVFWEKGYDGTSIEDLTTAMGINRPSLYATFGGKRDLFIRAIDRYASTHGNRTFSAFWNERDNQRAIERFLEASVECAVGQGTPRGCLINNVATDAAETDPELRAKLSKMFSKTDQAIANRLRANQGDEAEDALDPEATARMAHSITHSIMTRARAVATKEELNGIATSFVNLLFPTQPRRTSP